MKVNFFAQGCNSHCTAVSFGICDDPNSKPAYLDESDQNRHIWIAVVSNERKIGVQFVAVDNCINLLKENGDLESRCDGLITYERDIDFVELKDKRDSWLENGAAQIENTIRLFSQFHSLKNYRRRRAFVANRSFPNFTEYNTTTKERFRDLYNVRLFAQQKISI